MRKEVAISEGQLYKFKGATVRVVKPTNNDMWLVTGKGQLWGFAKDSQLGQASNRSTWCESWPIIRSIGYRNDNRSLITNKSDWADYKQIAFF